RWCGGAAPLADPLEPLPRLPLYIGPAPPPGRREVTKSSSLSPPRDRLPRIFRPTRACVHSASSDGRILDRRPPRARRLAPLRSCRRYRRTLRFPRASPSKYSLLRRKHLAGDIARLA